MESPQLPAGEAQTWTADNVNLTDLELMGEGPMEVLLLKWPTHEIIRLSYIPTLPKHVRSLADSPGFWIKILKRDGFILPEDILGFAEKWRKKHKTAAQYLRSFYYGFDNKPFLTYQMHQGLKKVASMLEKRCFRSDQAQVVQQLLSLMETDLQEVLPLEETVAALQISSQIYVHRARQPSTVTFNLQEVPRVDYQEGPLVEFFKKIEALRVQIVYSAWINNYSLDDTDANIGMEQDEEKKKRKEKKRLLRTQTHIPADADVGAGDGFQHPEINHLPPMVATYRGSRRVSQVGVDIAEIPNIQTLGCEKFKQKFIHRLSVIQQLAREGDRVVIGNSCCYYVFSSGGQLWVKCYYATLPGEALPFLAREGISNETELRTHYQASSINIEGRMVTLSDQQNKILRVGGHIFYVNSRDERELPHDSRCRWLTREEDKFRRCMEQVFNRNRHSYFCERHRQAEGHQTQSERCREEDEVEQEEVALETFPLLDDATQHATCHPTRARPAAARRALPTVSGGLQYHPYLDS